MASCSVPDCVDNKKNAQLRVAKHQELNASNIVRPTERPDRDQIIEESSKYSRIKNKFM